VKDYTFWYYAWGYRPRFIQGLRFWWKHRHETTKEREDRLAATQKRFAEIWIAHKEKMSIYPETRQMQEVREMLDEVIIGKECE